MSAFNGFYSSIADRLIKGSSRAILGLRGFRSEALREYLRSQLEQTPGEGSSLLADPVFEAAFGWKDSDRALSDLKGSLLNERLIDALAKPVHKDMVEDYTFPETRKPYRHQLEAWQALLSAEAVRSVLVSSGTGSGKTECFLIPILSDLAQEITRQQGGGLTGVRAVFLYPLNALIKSQKERLQAWAEPFAGQVRFCLYNGDTPEQGKTAWQCEVPDRRTLRRDPSQILVTNPTMLEYMLVRAEDRPILEQSKGKLRWIVIDEAHTYLGSQAAELTLLLRRTMHAFGCSPGEVHVVATSATLGEDGDEGSQGLGRFLAQLAGVPESRVTVVRGSREKPPEIEITKHGKEAALTLETLSELDAQELWEFVSREAPLVRMRDALVERPRTLSQMASLLFDRSDSDTKQHTLALIDACAKARDKNGNSFLPLRGHLFHRTLAGVWACANHGCSEKAGTALDQEGWPFGAVYLERRETCRCGTPVYELVQCSGCGAEYLSCEEVTKGGRDYLRPRVQPALEDEFQEQLEPLEGSLLDEGEEENEGEGVGRERLITSAEHATQHNIGLSEDFSLDWLGTHGNPVNLLLPEEDGLECPVCREKNRPGQTIGLFRQVRIGSPFLLTSTTPTLLSSLPAWTDSSVARPLEGRRLVTFTDSRQGTARSVVKAQQQVERDYIGSLIYHHLSTKSGSASATELAKQEEAVAELRRVVTSSPALRPVLDQEEAKLKEMRSPSLGDLSWDDMSAKLGSADDFRMWFKPALSDLTYGQLTDTQLVDLCIFREVFLRPRRQYSLEGMGLLQLRYPGLEKAEVPPVLKQKGLEQGKWVNFLRMAVDFFIRSGSPAVEISDDLRRWLGYPGKPSVLLAPGASKTQKNQRYWPSMRQPHARRNRLVRLLVHVFQLNLDAEADLKFLDEVLGCAWNALVKAHVLSPVEGGYRTTLKECARFQGVQEAWLCPVTRRLLPVTLKEITPYLPELPAPADLAVCERLTMPELPYPFWQGTAADHAERWLESDERIQRLRALGAWTDITDRLARYSHYYRAAEHSAQMSGAELTKREREFKDGKINLLSCSTTMEMGVDIGGLTAVAMNNVPPHPANFLQRAGRAGRRGESAALSFTLCKATPHGEAVYRNPLWPFTTRLATPQVDLRSAPIVQRHVNALALSTFLRQAAEESAHKLKAGWFFESDEPDSVAPVERFADWCESLDRMESPLARGVQSLIRGSVLEGMTIRELLARTADAVREVESRWKLEIDGLLTQQAALKTEDGRSKPEVAIAIRLDRWRSEYLLGQLATRAFLPGYGFPTGVVPFVTTTREDVERENRGRRHERDDDRGRRAGYPTRDLAIAIRDYAPGTDTVLNGRVFRSGGVTLNWQLPVDANEVPEIQDLRWVWRCDKCGSNGTRLTLPEACPACGNREPGDLTVRRFLQPAGFAVDFRSQPHNDITVPQYIPVKDPIVSMDEAEWMLLPRARLGRYRTAVSGHLFYHSEGVHDQGYSLCLRCGRADSMLPSGHRPKTLENHKRLQGGRLNDREQMCPGNHEDWAILDKVSLGATYTTEIFELQLRDRSGKPLNDRTIVYTLAVALRSAFCGWIGIDEGEIGATIAPGRDQDGHPVYSICLYDTASGGAGYASQIVGNLPALVKKVRDEVLECPNDCDSACQACLLTYETQHHLDELDRHAVLGLLSSDFVQAFGLPQELRVFGEQSALEMDPLALAVSREWQRQPFDGIRVFLGGPALEWEPLRWRFTDSLKRFSERGVSIELLVDEETFDELEQSQRDEVAVLANLLDATVGKAKGLATVWGDHGLVPVLEIGVGDASRRWAATTVDCMVPNIQWGSGEEGGQFVLSPVLDMPLSDISGSRAVDMSELRPGVQPGVVNIEIANELNGPASTFGKRAWERVGDDATLLAKALEGSEPIRTVHYSDRYLASPLSLVLLHRLITALREYSGGLTGDSQVIIRTASLANSKLGRPKLFSHDWRDQQDRKAAVTSLFGNLFPQFEWSEADRNTVPHSRELTLDWGGGKRWEIRLDQGVGYWEVENKERVHFPFSSSPARQLTDLVGARFNVLPRQAGHPTYWYCVPKNRERE